MLTIYSTKTCVWCKQVEKLLTMKNVPFEIVFIDDNAQLAQMLYEKTGYYSVPVTTDSKTFVVGWNVGGLNSLIQSQLAIV